MKLQFSSSFEGHLAIVWRQSKQGLNHIQSAWLQSCLLAID